jgi:hypothetical protein
MWLPNPVYHSLPHSYGVAGGLTLAHADSPVLLMSGMLLVAAGLLAWRLRRTYRAAARRRSRRAALSRPSQARRRRR